MPTFRFDRHRFDSRTGEIIRPDGSVARLQPQPAEVLTLLLERPSPEERPSFAPALGEALAAGDHGRAADLPLEAPVFRVPGSAGAWVARMVRENDRVWRIDPSFQEAPDPPAVERLASVSARVLVLVGSEDLLAVRRQAELLGRELPDARVETVPGGGHLLNLTDPTRFRAAVFPFLGVPAPARP